MILKSRSNCWANQRVITINWLQHWLESEFSEKQSFDWNNIKNNFFMNQSMKWYSRIYWSLWSQLTDSHFIKMFYFLRNLSKSLWQSLSIRLAAISCLKIGIPYNKIRYKKFRIDLDLSWIKKNIFWFWLTLYREKSGIKPIPSSLLHITCVSIK